MNSVNVLRKLERKNLDRMLWVWSLIIVCCTVLRSQRRRNVQKFKGVAFDKKVVVFVFEPYFCY